MISSTMPSAKYSCSGSPLILANGSTAIDGLSGSGSAGATAARRPSGPRSRGRVGEGAFRSDTVDPHRSGDVLDLLLAEVIEDKGQPVADVIVNRVGHKHGTGLGQGLNARRDVDAVAIEIVALDDHIAEIDADAQFDAAVRRDAGVPLGHRLLHRDRAAHRIDDAGKLYQQAVAGGLDDAASGARRSSDREARGAAL